MEPHTAIEMIDACDRLGDRAIRASLPTMFAARPRHSLSEEAQAWLQNVSTIATSCHDGVQGEAQSTVVRGTAYPQQTHPYSTAQFFELIASFEEIPDRDGHAASAQTVPAPVVVTPPSEREVLRAALRAWATFPVKASPRPLVLTSGLVAAPSAGFPTEDAKEAFLSGAFEETEAVPSGPREVAGYPVVNAAEALAIMRAEGSPAIGAPQEPEPLVISTIQLGTSSFGTDRGTRMLPAWLFTFAGVQDPAAVLAVAPSARFDAPAESLHQSSVGARLGRNGRNVTVNFVGGAPGRGPCTADYTVDQLDSETAVAIQVREVRSRVVRPSAVEACTALGYPRQERIVLASPLRNRVLIDATTKGPIAVAP